jgi:hypothetical protein
MKNKGEKGWHLPEKGLETAMGISKQETKFSASKVTVISRMV